MDIRRYDPGVSVHQIRIGSGEGHADKQLNKAENRQKLPREFTFKSANTLVELVRRGNGLIDKWDRDGFEVDLVIGQGGIWLRLSDEQFRALGGVL